MEKRMETGIKGYVRNELTCSELVLEGVVENEVDRLQERYQARMIQENNIPYILKMKSCVSGYGVQYVYDVSSYIPMERKLDKECWRAEEIQGFLNQLLEVLSAMSNYLLDINYLVLNPAYIFFKDDIYYFCYYPLGKQKIDKAFHTFTEYLVKKIDYSDYASVILACGLHKETMEDSYNLLSLIEEYADVEEQEEVKCIREEKTRLTEQRTRVGNLHDLWRDELVKGMDKNIDDERSDGSTGGVASRTDRREELGGVRHKFTELLQDSPVKRYFVQRKKDRWGVWDDLLSQK